MDGIQGAVLNVKLKYIEDWTEKRIEVANRYREMLTDVPQILMPDIIENTKHVYHLFVIRTDKRDLLFDYLQNKGISVGIHYPIALHNLKAYKYLNYKPLDLPNSNKFSKEILSLPIYPEIEEESLRYITSYIKKYFS